MLTNTLKVCNFFVAYGLGWVFTSFPANSKDALFTIVHKRFCFCLKCAEVYLMSSTTLRPHWIVRALHLGKLELTGELVKSYF